MRRRSLIARCGVALYPFFFVSNSRSFNPLSDFLDNIVHTLLFRVGKCDDIPWCKVLEYFARMRI